jgi:hypothetical protein
MVPQQLSYKLVTLLEILRAYAEAYVSGVHALTLVQCTIITGQKEGRNLREDPLLLGRLHSHLATLLPYCDHLPMTEKKVKELLEMLDSPERTAHWNQLELNFLTATADIISRLKDELGLILFFRIPVEKKKYFDNPLSGWEETIGRFQDAVGDIEEMSKCFALSRYAAAVFHSTQVIEHGLIALGNFLQVTDPKSGWTAVSNELDKIVVKTKHQDRSEFHKQHLAFLEQMHGVVIPLKSAWRNKISHAHGRLVLMTSDFSPDVAEEIMIASRSFMRRLATEMP